MAVFCLISAPTLFSAKSCILCLFLRLLGSVKWMRWSCWFGIVFLALLYGSTTVAYAVIFFPRGEEKWDFSLATKVTRNNCQLNTLLLGLFNVLSDIYLLILPLPIILRMNISRRKKIGLGAVFMTGTM